MTASGFCPWHGDESLRCTVLKMTCSTTHAFVYRWRHLRSREGTTCWDPPVTLVWPQGSGLCLHCLCFLPLTLSRPFSLATGPVFGVHSPSLPPSLPHKGLLFLLRPPGGDLCSSILASSPAPGPGAIRSARPRRWPQISWIYRAPHAAPPPSLPCLPLAPLLHLLLPSGCCGLSVTARRGQSGHSLRRSRGGSSAQFSWFQGGFV